MSIEWVGLNGGVRAGALGLLQYVVHIQHRVLWGVKGLVWCPFHVTRVMDYWFHLADVLLNFCIDWEVITDGIL